MCGLDYAALIQHRPQLNVSGFQATPSDLFEYPSK